MKKVSRAQNHEKLWSNITTGQSSNLREQTDDKKGKQNREDNSRERGVESQLKVAAQGFTQRMPTDPMVAPPDHDIRQSGRVLEHQNSDLCNRYVLALCILMTIREEPFKNYHSRTSEKWKAKDDKNEEFKKQKIKRIDDELSYADWQTSSWS